MIIYLSGAISSCLDTYKEKFKKAQRYFENLDHIVINPSMLPIGLDDNAYMPICMAMIDAADAFAIIDKEWKNSKGVVLEKKYAEYQGKLIIYDTSTTD